MIDFNKLDDYKVAIDDGFCWEEKEDDGNEGTGVIETAIFKSKEFDYSLYEAYNEEVEFMIIEKDWETFKKKVADYFLGVDSNEN